jgi:DNA polymerase-4
VGRSPGVGKVTKEKLKNFKIQTVADLKELELVTLEGRFGRYGVRLYELARGIDNSEVVADRRTQSISAEDTLTETEPMIRRLAEKTWSSSRTESRIARTVVLKLKTSDFQDSHAQPYSRFSAFFVRGADQQRPSSPRTCGPRLRAAIPLGGCRAQ